MAKVDYLLYNLNVGNSIGKIDWLWFSDVENWWTDDSDFYGIF
jgi:hypothetical protein